MYNKLAGMTGTAETEAGEFWEIYKLDVIEIPTNQPIIRIDNDDEIYYMLNVHKQDLINKLYENGFQYDTIFTGINIEPNNCKNFYADEKSIYSF